MATHRLLQREVLSRVFLYHSRHTRRLKCVPQGEIANRYFSNTLHNQRWPTRTTHCHQMVHQSGLRCAGIRLSGIHGRLILPVICANSYSTSEQNETLIDPAKELTSLSGTEIPGGDTASLASTAQDILQPVQEIPFTELGLGGYTPIGILQSSLEFLHMSAGLPWWATIITATIIARCALFPIIVKNQRASIKLNNVMPMFQKLTQKMNEARQSGNQFEMTKRNMELQRFVKKHDVNPLKTLVGVLVQAPIFISFFIGLRRMAQLPVESMTVGGVSWFTDLTTADPYYALPVLASLSMFAVIQLGAEAGVSSAQAEKIKTVLKIMPFVILPVIASLPKAVFIYWLTSNAYSLTQVALLKIPSVRQAFDIPERVKHDPADLPKSEGFFQGMKSGWENAKVQHEVDSRITSQADALRQAGTGPVPQTFAQDPTRPQPAASKSTSASSKPVRRKVR